MKNYIIILVLLFGLTAQSQKIGLDVAKFDPMTTIEMNALSSPEEGWEVFNTTTQSKWFYNGSAWIEQVSGGGAETDPIYSAWDKDYSDLINTPDLSNYLPLAGGVMTGNIILDGNNITGVGNLIVGLETNLVTTNITGSFSSNSNSIFTNDFRWTKTDTEPFAIEGAWYADDSENRPKYYDGASWKAVLLEGDASGSGTDDQTLTYNSTTNELSIEDGNTVTLPAPTVFNTVYIEDYGAIADDLIDDGAAAQLAVDDNVAGTVNYIKSKTGGKFIVANNAINLDGVKDIYFELHPDAQLIATGNFPLFTSIFDTTAGDVSVDNLNIDGFKIGSEYDANANGGTNGSSNGQDPNPLNPAVIWMGGVELDGFTFTNMELTNPLNNGYAIKLHNDSGTAFSKNIDINNNNPHDIGGMFVEIRNVNTPTEYRVENVDIYENKVDNLGLFGHGMAYSIVGTVRDVNIHHNTYSNLLIGIEIVGGSDYNVHDETFLEGVHHMFSISKDAAVATGMASNLTFRNLKSEYPQDEPSIIEFVENSTFTDISMTGGNLGGISVRHSKDLVFSNNKIEGDQYGLYQFTGDAATNTQSNENIIVYNAQLIQTSVGGNPVIATFGDQPNDVTFIGGSAKNVNGALWQLSSGTTPEPKYEHFDVQTTDYSEIINSYYDGLPTDLPTDLDYFLVDNGATATALAQQDDLTDITGTDEVVFNHMYTETGTRTNRSLRVLSRTGTYFLNGFVWDRFNSGYGTEFFSLEGTRGVSFNKNAGSSASAAFIIRNAATVKFKGFGMYIPVNGGLAILAENNSANGDREEGCVKCIFYDLDIFGEEDVIKLTNPFYNDFTNNTFRSRDGTVIEIRNESTSTAYGNSNFRNNWIRPGKNLGNIGLWLTSSTPTNHRITLTTLVGDHIQSFNQAADNQNTGILADAATNIKTYGAYIEDTNIGFDSDQLRGFNAHDMYISAKTSTTQTGVIIRGSANTQDISFNGGRMAGLSDVIPLDFPNGQPWWTTSKIHMAANNNIDLTKIVLGSNRRHDIRIEKDGSANFANAANPTEVAPYGKYVSITKDLLPFDPTGTSSTSTNLQDAVVDALNSGGGGASLLPTITKEAYDLNPSAYATGQRFLTIPESTATATVVSKEISTSSYTLLPEDSGKTLLFTNASGAIVTEASSPDDGFNVRLKPFTTGKVQLDFLTNGVNGVSDFYENDNGDFVLEYFNSSLGWASTGSISPYTVVEQLYIKSNAISATNENNTLPTVNTTNCSVAVQAGNGDAIQGDWLLRAEITTADGSDSFFEIRAAELNNPQVGDTYTVTYTARTNRAASDAHSGQEWFGIGGESRDDFTETFAEYTQNITIDQVASDNPKFRFFLHNGTGTPAAGDRIFIGRFNAVKTN